MVKLLEKLFKRKDAKKRTTEEDTLPLKKETGADREDGVTKPLSQPSSVASLVDKIESPFSVKPRQLMASCAQSIGLQRDHNEDALFCLTTTITGNGTSTPFGIYICADGMGGHEHGEVASEIAARTMASHIIDEVLRNLISNDPKPPEEPLQEIMREGVALAHENIIGSVSGGGTTLTAVTVIGNQMTIAHVGDSRVYTIRTDGTMKPLTRDHSLVKRLEELGQLTAEEAAVDPRRNVLYHALGQGTPLDPEIISSPIPHHGYLLVCSDGLWGVITEEIIGEIIRSTESLPIACQALVNAANEAGGPDNITAILIRLPD